MTYRVQLTIGAHSFDESWTAGRPPAGYRIIDPLIISWGYPSADSTPPAQPSPTVLQVSLAEPDAGTLADVGLGTPVAAIITIGTTTDPIRFTGLVTDAESSPILGTTGVRYDLTCTDATIDLANLAVAAVSAPNATTVRARLHSLLTEAGLTDADLVLDGKTSAYLDALPNLLLDFHDYGSAVLRDALLEVLSWLAVSDQPPDLAKPRYAPVLAPLSGTASYGAPYRWAVDAVPDAWTSGASDYPYVFGPGPGGWGPVPRPTVPGTGSTFIDACHVDADSSWTAIQRQVTTKGTAVYQVWDPANPGAARTTRKATYTQGALAAGRPPREVARVTETLGTVAANTPADQQAGANAVNLAMLLVPPPPVNAGWAPGEFTWNYDHRDPAAGLPNMFPNHAAALGTTARWGCYVRPMTIGGILEAWNVSVPGVDTLTGLLTSVKVTIDAAEVSVVFSLSPAQMSYAPGSTGLLRWDDVPAGTPTWDQLDPRYTWDDYNLIGA